MNLVRGLKKADLGICQKTRDDTDINDALRKEKRKGKNILKP